MSDEQYLASRQQAEVISAWVDAKAMAKKYSDEADELRKRIVEFLADPETDALPEEVWHAGHLILRPNQFPVTRFDSQKLKQLYPALYEQFSKTSTTTRLDTP